MCYLAAIQDFFMMNKKLVNELRFATPMKSMIDSDNVPHLPKLGKACR